MIHFMSPWSILNTPYSFSLGGSVVEFSIINIMFQCEHILIHECQYRFVINHGRTVFCRFKFVYASDVRSDDSILSSMHFAFTCLSKPEGVYFMWRTL